jgi:hypothetical protein
MMSIYLLWFIKVLILLFIYKKVAFLIVMLFDLAYEIWFKQIIFELDSITNLLAKPVNFYYYLENCFKKLFIINKDSR